MILIPVLSPHLGWKLEESSLSCQADGRGGLSTFYLPSFYGISQSPLPSQLAPPTSSSPLGLSLSACMPLAYANPSTWHALSPPDHLFKSHLESALGVTEEF